MAYQYPETSPVGKEISHIQLPVGKQTLRLFESQEESGKYPGNEVGQVKEDSTVGQGLPYKPFKIQKCKISKIQRINKQKKKKKFFV